MLLIFKEFTDSLCSEIKKKIEVCFLGAMIIKFGNNRWESIYSYTGCGHGGFREDFLQEVILELILKHRNWQMETKKQKHLSGRQVQRQKANTIKISSGSCKVPSEYLWGDDWKALGGLGPGICTWSGSQCRRCWWVRRGGPGARAGVLLVGDSQG